MAFAPTLQYTASGGNGTGILTATTLIVPSNIANQTVVSKRERSYILILLRKPVLDPDHVFM